MAETLCTPEAQHVAIPSCVFPDGAVPFMGNEDCVGVEDNGKLIFSPVKGSKIAIFPRKSRKQNPILDFISGKSVVERSQTSTIHFEA